MNVEVFCFDAVAPVRERGLKCNHAVPRLKNLSRSREGAWIEMALILGQTDDYTVAPVRERGLKYTNILSIRNDPLSLP